MNRNIIIADLYIQLFEDRQSANVEAIIESDRFVELPGLAIAALNAAADGDNSRELQAIGQKVLDCIEDFIGDDRIDEEIASEPPVDYLKQCAPSIDEYLDDPRRGQASELNAETRRASSLYDLI